MMDLVGRICAAIIRQEGMAASYLNPGNLRGAPWYSGAVIENGFWKPPSRIIGEAGLFHLVALHLAEGNTLHDFIAGHPGVYGGFAPGADRNDPETYILHVMAWTGIPDADLPLYTWLELPELTT